MNDEPPPFNHELATELIGKHLLVGITYLRSSGDLIEQRPFHGIVESAGVKGIQIRLAHGSDFRLPPDVRSVEPAPPGTYRLRSTGEEVEDPNYLCSWTITRPDA